ncbi:MAG: response regulator transcription factor [Chloroflexota bacterium]
MYTILVADDEPIMLSLVETLLKKEGYSVVRATSAEGVFEQLEHHQPDLFLIDVNLPDRNGILLCEDLRENPDFLETPIVFLTAGVSEPEDVARALNAGGDDFIRKPFAARELAARIRAHLRRVRVRMESRMTHLYFVPSANTVTINNGEPIELTQVEFNLLSHMCAKPNKWQTTRDLLAEVWRYPGNIGDAALVRNHIRNIRLKIEPNPDYPTIIKSRHRRGYLVEAVIEVAEEAAG